MPTLILCRTMIHLAYLSLVVSAAIRGNTAGAIALAVCSLIVPRIVARLPKGVK